LELDSPIEYNSNIKNIPLLPDAEEKNMFVGGTSIKAAGWGVHNYPYDSDTLYTTDLVTLDTSTSLKVLS
jgi:hypothetical protein